MPINFTPRSIWLSLIAGCAKDAAFTPDEFIAFEDACDFGLADFLHRAGRLGSGNVAIRNESERGPGTPDGGDEVRMASRLRIVVANTLAAIKLRILSPKKEPPCRLLFAGRAGTT